MNAVDVARARKPVKTLFGWLIFRRVSMPISLRLARTRIRPAQITGFGLACGLAGAALLGTGRYREAVAGAGLVAVAKLMDAIDGEVARAKRLDTPSGYVADGLCDRARDTALLAGLGIGAARMHVSGAWPWTMGALVGYLLFFYVSAAAPSHWREVRTPSDLDEKHMVRVGPVLRLGAGDTLAVAALAAAIGGRPLWPLIAVASLAPVAITFKIRRLFHLRPWQRREE